MMISQNDSHKHIANVKSNLFTAARLGVWIGVFGLVNCFLWWIGFVAAVLASVSDKETEALLPMTAMCVGLALTTYFCRAALRFGREVRRANSFGEMKHYRSAFRYLERMFWGVVALITFLVITAIYVALVSF